ncbi:MAG: arsenosugar biosynthesis radical SAM protein ArsS [Akkermansiaceae bacterium]|nr:arsenosugar biosynthesis radical SAM protein ArsS [Armatimonadota bacterium]
MGAKLLPTFAQSLSGADLFPLTATGVSTLQVNVGKRCNQACKHCHVDAGPQRSEEMTRETTELVIEALRSHATITTLDITGGAPELNPHFRYLAEAARQLGRHVIDRCNLTILFEPGQKDLAHFLAANRVEVVASLPYYLAERTDRQRGLGVFDKSVEGLHLLNSLGFGVEGSGLTLNLVYNPNGAFLPPDQTAMETEFRHELKTRYGIVFSNLFTLTNLPIARFKHFLERSGNYDKYMAKLSGAFNPGAAANVMCRSLVSVGYEGTLYDCDFNQMLELPVDPEMPGHIRDFDAFLLARRRIVTGSHCYGCTAGAGSSCGGAVA